MVPAVSWIQVTRLICKKLYTEWNMEKERGLRRWNVSMEGISIVNFHERINSPSSISYRVLGPLFHTNSVTRSPSSRFFSRYLFTCTLPWASFRVDVPGIMFAFIEYLAAGLPLFPPLPAMFSLFSGRVVPTGCTLLSRKSGFVSKETLAVVAKWKEKT